MKEDRIMWVYREDGKDFVVGFYTPDRQWVQDSICYSREEARRKVHYLNGGE